MHSITAQPNSSAATRRARWNDVVPSARCLGAATLALLVVFPLLLTAVDHHTAERIPSHQHFVSFGEMTPDHGHEFERAHEHAGPTIREALAAPVAVRQSAAFAALSLVQNLALPLLLFIAFCQVSRRALPVAVNPLNDQIAIAPPTLPPARLAVV